MSRISTRPLDSQRRRIRQRDVVVQEPAETLTTPNPTAANLHGPRAVDEFVPEALVIALAVIVLDKLADRLSQVALASGITRSRHSSLIERTNRSAYAFALGAWYGVCTIPISESSNSWRTGALHLASRSQINTR